MQRCTTNYIISVLAYHMIRGGKKVPPDVYTIHYLVMVFIGCLSKDVVKYGLMKKKFSACLHLNHLSLPFNGYQCLINWTGSSGATEDGLAFDLVIKMGKMFKWLVYIKEIITDDDSTMRHILKTERQKIT